MGDALPPNQLARSSFTKHKSHSFLIYFVHALPSHPPVAMTVEEVEKVQYLPSCCTGAFPPASPLLMVEDVSAEVKQAVVQHPQYGP